MKRLAAFKAAPADSDSDSREEVLHKKKASTGVLPARKQQVKKKPNHKGSQQYWVLCKKAGIIDCKYKSHSSRNCFVYRSYQKFIKEDL